MTEGTNMSPTELPRRTVTLDADTDAALMALVRRRFGGKVSPALRAAVEALLVLYNDPSTYMSEDGADAVRDYAEAFRIFNPHTPADND